MDIPTIRIVSTSADDLADCNVEHIVPVFSAISQVPDKAKAPRGRMLLGFPPVEDVLIVGHGMRDSDSHIFSSLRLRQNARIC